MKMSKERGLAIAHRHQNLTLDDEGDGVDLRLVAIGPADDRGGHEDGVALGVEAARGLDLGKLLAHRDVDPERRLDGCLLARGWPQEIDPTVSGGSDTPLFQSEGAKASLSWT